MQPPYAESRSGMGTRQGRWAVSRSADGAANAESGVGLSGAPSLSVGPCARSFETASFVASSVGRACSFGGVPLNFATLSIKRKPPQTARVPSLLLCSALLALTSCSVPPSMHRSLPSRPPDSALGVIAAPSTARPATPPVSHPWRVPVPLFSALGEWRCTGYSHLSLRPHYHTPCPHGVGAAAIHRRARWGCPPFTASLGSPRRG